MPIQKQKNFQIDTRLYQEENVYKHNFLNDSIALFSHQVSGHMNTYAFSDGDDSNVEDKANGSYYWSDFIRNSKHYYIFSEEVELIQNKAVSLASLLPYNPDIIDLGPGSRTAVRNKTFPVLEALKTFSSYYSVDISERFANNACEVVKQHFNPKKGNYFTHDFLREKMPFQSGLKNPVMVLFGGLLANTPLNIGLLKPANTLEGYFEQLRQNFDNTSYLVITQDTNDEIKKLTAAYTHPSLTSYILSLLYRMKNELPMKNFHPENFDFKPLWEPQKSLLSLNAVSLKQQRFQLGHKQFTVEKDEVFPLVNCFKFKMQDFIGYAESAGWAHVDSLIYKNSDIVMHVFKSHGS